jgi:protocatechuate 3,4-dioxygenase, alpha subunit
VADLDLTPTPGQTVGPFYAYALCYPGDSQLVPPGTPGALRLHGTVRDGHGAAVPDALLEIRQADPTGSVPAVAGSFRRDGHTFTGWGRCGTDPAGHYSFTTLEPGPHRPGGPRYLAVTVFARGLLNRLFTRAYLPEDVAGDAAMDRLLAGLPVERRRTLVAEREPDGALRFDVHLQGERETVFLRYPRHRA